jgi:hypothetical protein
MQGLGGSILGTCIGERQSTDSTSINPNMTLVYAETDEAAMRQAVAELGKLIFPKFSQVATSVATGTVN